MEGGSGVQRRVRDQAARQRRGSIKSRIVQFSKVSTEQYSTVQYHGTALYIFWWVATILGTDRASRARELSELKFKLPLTAAVSGLSPLLSPGHSFTTLHFHSVTEASRGFREYENVRLPLVRCV